jgi:hypothetical protein
MTAEYRSFEPDMAKGSGKTKRRLPLFSDTPTAAGLNPRPHRNLTTENT